MDLLAELTRRFLAKPVTTERYYLVWFIGLPSGRIETGCLTYWVDFADLKRQREIRRGRLLAADKALWHQEWLRRVGQDCQVVRTPDDLLFFYLVGGNALVEQRLAESEVGIQDVIGPRVCVQVGLAGFHSVESLSDGSMNRAPKAQLRMSVLKRDDYRCRICGRRASDYVDVQLHVHHIRPWSMGGITADENLITLCHTCHAGLSPHAEFRLFDLVKPLPTVESLAKEYRRGLERYWELTSVALNSLDGRRRETARSDGRSAKKALALKRRRR